MHAAEKISGKVHSTLMDRDIDFHILLPKSYAAEGEKTFPVLYAMHGYGAPVESWVVMTPLAATIDGDCPMAVVTFDGGTSFYLDHEGDPTIQMTGFFFKELVPYIEKTYRVGGSSGMRAATGFSMGGFGAWHLMLEQPEFFASVSALSGAFGRIPESQENVDLFKRIEAVMEAEAKLPPTYIGCGTDDYLIDHSRKMAMKMIEKGYLSQYVETPGAAHNWPYWKNASDELAVWHFAYFAKRE